MGENDAYVAGLKVAAKHFGITRDVTIRKAAEMLRVLSTKHAIGLDDQAKCKVCLHLAAIQTGEPFSEGAGDKKFGAKYRSQLQTVGNLLGVSGVSIHSLAVKHSAIQAESLANTILKQYKEQSFELDEKLPMYQVGALVAACKIKKVKVDRKNLYESSGVKKKVFDAIVEKFIEVGSKLDQNHFQNSPQKENLEHGKRSAASNEQLIQSALSANKEGIQKKKKLKIEDAVESYEDWKQRMLDEAAADV